MTNPLLGTNRQRIFSAALAAAGRGARVIDDGAPLTLWEKSRTTEIGIVRSSRRVPRFTSQNRSTVVMVRVNVDTLETSIID